MRVEFKAFADDAIIRGELLLEGERLSDFLPQEGPFEIEHVSVEALEDGRVLTIASAIISRSDLVAITGSGPRGEKAQRIRTRPHAARAQAGPYEIVGYVHAPPSAHPFSGVLRRRVLPVTSAVIRYRIGGRHVEESHDVLLVNPEKMEWLAAATDLELRLNDALELPFKVDPRAKDMTGEIRT
jgi:hypothetical protein